MKKQRNNFSIQLNTKQNGSCFLCFKFCYFENRF